MTYGQLISDMIGTKNIKQNGSKVDYIVKIVP